MKGCCEGKVRRSDITEGAAVERGSSGDMKNGSSQLRPTWSE